MALASAITTRVQSSLGDIAKVRYPDAELLKFIGDAQRLIVQIWPDSNVTFVSHDVVTANCRQTLVAPLWKLLKVDSNSTGTTQGTYIPLVEFDMLDSMMPGWRNYVPAVAKRPAQAAGKYYTAYAHDPRQENVFYLFPQGLADRDVFVLASSTPDEPTAIGNTLTLGNEYMPPIVDYVIYRAMLREGRFALDPQLAQMYWDRFLQSLQAIDGGPNSVLPQSYKAPEGP